MRILAVANRYPPWSVGGYEAMSAGADAELRRRGHELRVLTTGPDPSDRASDAAPESHVHRDLRWYWRDHAFPPISLRATVALERANARALGKHVAEWGPDVILWWGMGGMSLSLLEQARRTGRPAVGVVGDDWMNYGPRVDAWTRRWRGVRAPLAPFAERLSGVPAGAELVRAARWVFISEHLRARAPVPPDGTVVAHPGIDKRRFARDPVRAWGWRLLYCGRIDPRKGIDTAIEALPHLPAEARLTIDGDGDRGHASELATLAEGLGLREHVEMRCSAPGEVPAAYAAADALVFPVLWEEPWGLVPLEAMAVGRPVVASRAGGGVAEYLRDGENCIQFPPGDAATLAAALRRLADDPELRARLVAGGLKTAARFTDLEFHDALERELESALGRGVRSLT